MKISDRFTDYGLIGGFFWILQLAVWLVIVGRNGWTAYLNTFTATLNVLPAAAVAPFVALLGALALIAVFTTGLLLDLLGSWYTRATEMMVFVRHARYHNHWFQRVADLHSAYIQEDCSLLLSVPPYKTQFRVSLKFFKVWNKRDREDYWLLVRRTWKARQAYARIQSFLLSYVLLASGVEKLELLSTQMALWNTGRAIATAVMISATEVGLSWFVLLYGREGVVGALDTKVFLPLIGGELLLGILGFSVAASCYERVCGTLFALMYVISEKSLLGEMSASTGPPSPGGPNAPAPVADKTGRRM